MSSQQAFRGNGYSAYFDTKTKRWKANIRKPDGSWTTKWVPREIGEDKRTDAEAFIVSHIRGSEQAPAPDANTTLAKTLEILIPRWLETIEPETGFNYFRGLTTSAKTWILNSKRRHRDIQHLNLETQFTPELVKDWAISIGKGVSTKINAIQALEKFFDDVIYFNWIEIQYNPVRSVKIAKHRKELRMQQAEQHQIKTIPWEQLCALVKNEHQEIKPMRRMRYLVAITTGMRDKEIQALRWEDFRLSGCEDTRCRGEQDIPHIHVNYNLLKRGRNDANHFRISMSKGVSKSDLIQSDRALICRPKNQSGRIIALHPATVRSLIRWRQAWFGFVGREAMESDPVFPRGKISLQEGDDPSDFCRGNPSELLRKDLERLEFNQNGTFHAIRRSFASKLEDLDVDSAVIKRMMGHKRQGVTEGHYVKGSTARMLRAVSLLQVPDAYIPLPAALVKPDYVSTLPKDRGFPKAP